MRTIFRHSVALIVIGSCLAVALVVVGGYRTWTVPAVAALLYFTYLAYRSRVNRLDDHHHRPELLESLDCGVCILDRTGQVTRWNGALARITGCPREQALGRSLVAAVPGVGQTDLPKAISEASKTRSGRVLKQLGLPSSTDGQIVKVTILPDESGVTVLWHDLTERLRTERALSRSEERFARIAAGAHDGLWDWDLRSQEIYFSGQWRAMLGLPSQEGSAHPDDWFGRVHSEDIDALKAALQAYLSGETELFQHEHRIRHEGGTYRRFLCRGVRSQTTLSRAAHIAGSLTDVTERTKTREQLRSSGYRDPLTGLINRTVFVEGLGQQLDAFKTRHGRGFAVLYLDLDRFKVVNDSLGHLVGDELLNGVSRRLESCLREGDALARLGGDEFAILLNGLDDEGQANAVAFRLQDALRAPFSIGGREVFTSASIGIAFSGREYNSPDEMMRDADTAMYQAKAGGQARHELFDSDMHAEALDRIGLESDLRHAVENHDFKVHYQPIVSLASGRCEGFESLIRWSRNGQAVSPAKFIPMAEELGLIETISTWVLQEACRTFADWQRRFPDSHLECITVNVSTRQLVQQGFLKIIEQAVQDADLTPCDLRLEITETTLMESPRLAAEALRELREFGVKIYLDDFGTGYSSLRHLHKLPVDALKIDRSFVKSLLLPERPAIVESILALARTLHTGVIAEGVENDVQSLELERLGCRHAQGYLFSPAISSVCVEEMLLRDEPLGPMHVNPSHPTNGSQESRRPRPRSAPRAEDELSDDLLSGVLVLPTHWV